MIGFGLYSISPFHDAANFELLLLGFLAHARASSLRDSFFFEKIENNPQAEAAYANDPCPIFGDGPQFLGTLRKLNEWLANHENKGKIHLERKTTRQQIFIHIPQKPPSSSPWDMWIFVIKDRLFPMVPMIGAFIRHSLERCFV